MSLYKKYKVFKMKDFSLYIIIKFIILALTKNSLSKLIILVLMESVNFRYAHRIGEALEI
jgi:hypothetical protein